MKNIHRNVVRKDFSVDQNLNSRYVLHVHFAIDKKREEQRRQIRAGAILKSWILQMYRCFERKLCQKFNKFWHKFNRRQYRRTEDQFVVLKCSIFVEKPSFQVSFIRQRKCHDVLDSWKSCFLVKTCEIQKRYCKKKQ